MQTKRLGQKIHFNKEVHEKNTEYNIVKQNLNYGDTSCRATSWSFNPVQKLHLLGTTWVHF